ncbi:AAA family ATPase [Peptoniphilus indolicus]|uniref:Predicted ATP-binding protein involved in virulence n=1 Tax=Peptoniphilus indolicus TaxID=33030 RepID=A0A379DCT4_9FIRM|nr:AAA family ATPase [Peptoniphilus indolicus]SUB75798.1 Predicted ATP-binding protein involved in virulence [Peptoniphilus indolicus]
MLYLREFKFPTMEAEAYYFRTLKRTCHDTYYPFQIFRKNRLTHLAFEPITILYGGNGSGKSTILNIISEKLKLNRDALYNRSNFFEDYINLCHYELDNKIPRTSETITSDDVFNFMLDLRSINNGISSKREELFEEYLENKYTDFQLRSLDDYEKLKKINMTRKVSQSQYVRNNLINNTREYSNGESAFMYFQNRIRENALYLLDEPENSLSPQKQLELIKFLEDSVRFFECQFIIATHSPFILSLKYAKIYDLDGDFVTVKDWTELENVRIYYNFFKEHSDSFKE